MCSSISARTSCTRTSTPGFAMASSGGQAVAQVIGEARPPRETGVRPPTAWQRFLANRWAIAGAGVVLGVVGAAVLAPVLPLRDPNGAQPARRLSPPFAPWYVLGADHLGRDLLSRVIWGARVSLLVGVLSTALAVSVGTTVGLTAGYYGGRADLVIMRALCTLMALPLLLLC